MGLKQKIGDLFRLGEIKDSVLEIIDTKFQLKKLEIQEKIEYGMTELIYLFLLGALWLLFTCFVLLLLAYFVNLKIGEPWGLVVVLGFILIAILSVWLNKTAIKKKARERIMKEVDGYSL